MKYLTTIVFLSIAVLLPACSSGDSPTPDQEASNTVEVASDGTRFDPPEAKENMPDGAWICDMGKAHFASMTKGDGQCPTCGMSLKEHHVDSAEHESSD